MNSIFQGRTRSFGNNEEDTQDSEPDEPDGLFNHKPLGKPDLLVPSQATETKQGYEYSNPSYEDFLEKYKPIELPSILTRHSNKDILSEIVTNPWDVI